MDDVGPICAFFMIAFIIIGVIAIVWASAANRSKELTSTYALLARQYGGRLHPGTWFERPSVTFDHRGNWVRVDIHSTGGKNPTHYTQVHMGWPEPGFRMEVYPEGFFNRVGKFLGMQDIEIGSPHFDRDYIITGNDAGMLKETLSPAAQAAINGLRGIYGNGNVYVTVRNWELLVKKLGIIDNIDSLSRLTALTLQLYDAALAGQEKGIEFLDMQTIDPTLHQGPEAEEVICQVCGDTIVRDVVLCRSCKTPHHQDCWQYYGQCSTFGCGQHSYRRPRKKSNSKRK